MSNVRPQLLPPGHPTEMRNKLSPARPPSTFTRRSSGFERGSKAPDPATPPSTHGFQIKDVVSVSIASAAALISLVSLYYSAFRVQEEASARVVATSLDLEPLRRNGRAESFLVSVAYFNTGNRQVVLSEPRLYFFAKMEGTQAGYGVDWSDSDSKFPIVLTPNDLRVVTFKLPISEILRQYAIGDPTKGHPLDHESEDMRQVFAAMQFRTVSASGKAYRVWSRNELQAKMTKTRWKSFGPTRSISDMSRINLLERLDGIEPQRSR